MTLQNEKFEELISAQLESALEPQRGRAAAAFRAQMAAEAAEQAAVAGGSKDRQTWARKEVSGKSLLFWTGMPSLIAAALALAVTLYFTGAGAKPVNPVNPIDRGTMANNPSNPFGGGSPGTNVILVAHPTLMPEPTGVLIIKDPNIQTVSQPVYQTQPAQWTDPVDHTYHLAEKP